MSASDYLAVCRAVESVALFVIIYVFYRGRRAPSVVGSKDVARSDAAPPKNPISDSDLDRQCEEARLAYLQADLECDRVWGEYIALRNKKISRDICQGKK